MTDAYTEDLFVSTKNKYEAVVFPVSRLVVDPERFVDDKKEKMSKKGMGVIYSLTSDGKNLRRNITDQEREFLINKYYHSHHQKLNDTVENHLKKYGKSFIVDCHSFPSVPLPYESNQSKDRPDICIGTDNFHKIGRASCRERV